MATLLSAHRSSVVVAACLFFGSGALIGAVLAATGPWGRLEAAFVGIAVIFAVRAVWLVRRIVRSIQRTLSAWMPKELRNAVEGISPAAS